MLLKKLFSQISDVLGLVILLFGFLIAFNAFGKKGGAPVSRDAGVKRKSADVAQMPGQPVGTAI